ncbi:hypothetical protein NMY22_g19668 [Coprinellus aureogranulatus]|nr:hypothetical protein NMY22_g19668 [Coprinellus aureogranulatus]
MGDTPIQHGVNADAGPGFANGAAAYSRYLTPIVPMPIAGTANAPTFDGKNVTQFLKILQQHGRNAQLSDNDLLPYIIPYCTDEVQRVLRYADEIEGTDATWKSASDFLVELYGAEDKTIPKRSQFEQFVAQGRHRKDFTSRADLDRYHREFRALAGPLRQTKKLTDNEINLKFFEGLPKGIRSYYVQNATEAHRTTDSAAPISEVIKIVSNLYNPNRIEWYTLGEREEKDDEDDNEATTSAGLAPHFTTLPPAKVSEPNSSNGTNTSPTKDKAIEDLTQQLQQLSLNQAQLQQLVSSVLAGNANMSGPRPQNGNQVCFVCGKSGTHRLHPRYCPETAQLLNEQLIKFSVEQNRFVLPNGDNLPQVPFTEGGVAKYLRDNRARILAMAGNRDPPPHITAKTSSASLMLGSEHVFQGDVFAIAANEPTHDTRYYEDYGFGHYDSYPVTRSGRDTSARHNPIQRPATKLKTNDSTADSRKPTDPVTAGVPRPQSQPSTPNANPRPPTPANNEPHPPHFNRHERLRLTSMPLRLVLHLPHNRVLPPRTRTTPLTHSHGTPAPSIAFPVLSSTCTCTTPHSSNPRIHMWKNVEEKRGEVSVELMPRWWNSSASEELQVRFSFWFLKGYEWGAK